MSARDVTNTNDSTREALADAYDGSVYVSDIAAVAAIDIEWVRTKMAGVPSNAARDEVACRSIRSAGRGCVVLR